MGKKMTKKQKIVADYIIDLFRKQCSSITFLRIQDMKKASNLDELFNAYGVTEGEMVFNGAMEAHYSISTLNEIDRNEAAGYRIYNAIKDYIWNEWKKFISDEKIQV